MRVDLGIRGGISEIKIFFCQRLYNEGKVIVYCIISGLFIIGIEGILIRMEAPE